MAWVIAGLGNPGEEYDLTRHNTGRMAVDFFAHAMKFSDWHVDMKAKAHVRSGMVGKTAVALVAPDTFMNKSGVAVARFVKSAKAAERLVVVHDDLDLPLGSMKISYDRGSGGHKGLESVMRAVKTKRFIRVRIGVSPTTTSGLLRKPEGEKAVLDFILTKFSVKGGSTSGGKTSELGEMRKVFKRVAEALTTIVSEGRERAMNEFNC